MSVTLPGRNRSSLQPPPGASRRDPPIRQGTLACSVAHEFDCTSARHSCRQDMLFVSLGEGNAASISTLPPPPEIAWESKDPRASCSPTGQTPSSVGLSLRLSGLFTKDSSHCAIQERKLNCRKRIPASRHHARRGIFGYEQKEGTEAPSPWCAADPTKYAEVDAGRCWRGLPHLSLTIADNAALFARSEEDLIA